MPQYSYIAVGHKYFPARCNFFSLAWTLLIKHKSNNLDSLELRRRHVPGILKAVFRCCYRHTGPNVPDIMTLPAFGHICIRVHQGYKVFDFSRYVTTKVFDQDIDRAAVESEINAVRNASSLSFTPTLIEADPGNRWYSETLIPGERSTKSAQSVPELAFKQVIASHICEIVLSNPVHTIGLSEYTSNARDAVDQNLERSQLDRGLSTHVNNFVSRIITSLGAAENIPVQLAFTHGDFSFVNFVYSNNIAVIDWESAQYRSILNDLYNYFLTELYYGRTRKDLVKEINDAISLLTRLLKASNESMQFDTLEKFRDTYRWLYYIERIEVLLDREPSDIQQNVIRRSIETFTRHEAFTSSNHEA